MKKLTFIWIVLFAIMLAGACSRLDEPKAALNIYVRLPEEAATKAVTLRLIVRSAANIIAIFFIYLLF